jgi:uncharacterized protein (TIGR00251 family)
VFYKDDGTFCTLKIKAQPNASKSEFAGLYGEDAIKVRLAAPAVEGAANKELIKFIAKKFKVAKSNVEFVSGHSSKIKLIKVEKTIQLEEFIKEIESGR